MAFDALSIEGKDLRGAPLEKRKRRLKAIMSRIDSRQKGAATGMLTGGLLALIGITLTSVSDIVLKTRVKNGTPNPLRGLENFWIAHPGIRILCEQPAIWAVPLAITLMIIVSKLTRREVPSDVRMKMLVLHAPEKLGLKQEYIQEHQGMGH